MGYNIIVVVEKLASMNVQEWSLKLLIHLGQKSYMNLKRVLTYFLYLTLVETIPAIHHNASQPVRRLSVPFTAVLEKIVNGELLRRSRRGSGRDVLLLRS